MSCLEKICNFFRNWIVIILIILVVLTIPIIIYYKEFGDFGISPEHDNWGQFGDYFGGILNPLIAILSLIVTVYIANLANKINKQQNRPYCNIIFNDYENDVGVDIENVGNGPLIIKSLKIYESNDNSKSNIKILRLLPKLPHGESWTNFVEEVDGRAISSGRRLNLFSLQIDEKNDSPNRRNLRDHLRKILSTKKISVEYIDIHDNQLPVKSRDMTFFGRPKNKKE